MALAMFGAITIQMPAAVQSFWHRTSGGLRDSHFAIFALGAGSALIVGACVSPVLISFLGLAVSGGDVALGAALMAAVAAGMGMPLLAVALGGGHYLPRAGRWMTAVKHGIGILLLGTAIYLLGALPAVPVLMLWAVYLACIAIYLWHKAGMIQHRTRTIVKTASIGLCVWAAAAMVGGIGGGRDLFAPVAWHGQPELASTFMRVASLRELDARLADAAAENKLAVLDYYADWCVDCVRMENTTLRDARVRELLAAEFIALQVDVSNPRDKNSAALKSRYGVYGPPAVLFFDRNGRPIRDAHFYGYIDAARFYTLIAGLANETQQ